MARPSNRETRREQIIDGFQTVLARQGYEKATIAAIAKAAGLTSGLIHYHFSSKQEILLELVTKLGSDLHERYRSMLRDAQGAEARLAAFMDSRLAVGPGSNPEAVACWVAIGTEALRQAEVQKIYRDLMFAQRDSLEEILITLVPEASERREVACALLAAIEGCYQLACAVPDLTQAGFAARSLRKMAEGLLNCKLPS